MPTENFRRNGYIGDGFTILITMLFLDVLEFVGYMPQPITACGGSGEKFP
jgi:hypothetical protein